MDIFSGMGGHPEQQGAKLTVVVLPSFRRIAIHKEESTDYLYSRSQRGRIVTERGICINPAGKIFKQALIVA